ncbi:MAG: coproporphyrinogen III oxidase [Bacteroidia bacterium]|jgi:oxygen-independent coproporphyrinogen-3 oxidase|nr:MAG: coproporphyrinogen III oxidase [Bacteroidia bacterium]
MDSYVEALLLEIELYKPLLAATRIETVFFGGGTPSWLPSPLWEKIWRALSQLPTFFPIEVTLEANPEDISAEKLHFWKDLGITRISVGIQSFSEKVLQRLGRWHTPNQARQATELIARAGFPSWNADIIFAVPEQTVSDLAEDLQYLVELGVPHLSLYGLTIEKGTALYKKYKRKMFEPVEDDIYTEQYLFIHDFLEKRGFIWYEISNWAQHGHECQHNWRYWLRRPYLGLGPSAHSYIPEVRWANIRHLPSYLLALKNQGTRPWAMHEQLSQQEVWEEIWLTFLRTRAGVPISFLSHASTASLHPKLSEWTTKGWLSVQNEKITISKQGALIIDNIVKYITNAYSE